jgi:probable HAF family extracellular repeat protein
MTIYTYTYTMIDPPGSIMFWDTGINDKAQVIGEYQDSTGQHGFFYDHGTYTTIDPPGSIGTSATFINDESQIIGQYSTQSGSLGFLYDHGTYTTIDPFGLHSVTELTSINDKGQIVGGYRDSNGAYHDFLYSHGTYTNIDFPGAIDTFPGVINDKGQIVGGYQDSSGQSHGFLDNHGTFTTIDPPGSISTSITFTNDNGYIVGYFQERSGGPEQGFLYSHGTYTIIDFPGASRTLLTSINDKGQIDGGYIDSNGVGHGFVDSNGVFTTLDPPSGGAISPINEYGQLVIGAYLATPAPVMLDAISGKSVTTLSGTAEANSSVSIFDGTQLLGEVTAAANGTWNFNTKATLGLHTYTETLIDGAGVTSASTGVTLFSPTGAQTLQGGTGNDVLIGAPNDILQGNAGNDTFVFNKSFGQETVADFNVNQDVLAFNHTLFAHDTAAQVLSQTHDSSAGAVIVVHSHDSITLLGVTVAQLQAAQAAHVDWIHFF